MPIQYQPEGLGELHAKLAYQTGAAKANVQVAQEAREDRIRTEEWERQDRMEQARNALKEQAEMRAMSWEFEKMEIRSRNDFELEELQNRAKVMAAAEKEIQDQRQMEAKIKAIEDHPRLSPEEKENYVLEIRTGIKAATAEQKHQYAMTEIAARAAAKGTSTPDVKDLLSQNKTMIDFQAEFKQDKKGTWQRKPTRAGEPVLPATKEEVAALTAYNAILAKNIPEIARLGMIQANGGTAPGTPPAAMPLRKMPDGTLLKQLPNGNWVPVENAG